MQTVSLHCFSLKESCFNLLSYSDVELLEVSIYFQISFSIQLFNATTRIELQKVKISEAKQITPIHIQHLP